MQEREIIYKILFSSVAPYLLITANLIIVVCIIKILWITVKNKNKKNQFGNYCFLLRMSILLLYTDGLRLTLMVIYYIFISVFNSL